MNVRCPVQCVTCNGTLYPDEQNGGSMWRCRWCPTVMCDFCYWRHTADKHPEKR